MSGWQDYSPKNIPQQNNGYDCGVFACQFAECLSRADGGAGEEERDVFNFTQADMPFLRKRLVVDILNKSIPATLQ